MTYIETHQSLFTHRKTLRLARLLQLDIFAIVGRLMALWCWALDNAPDGAINANDADILADVMGWSGEPQTLCEALIAAGFIEYGNSDADHYLIHDWQDYAGRLIEKRRIDADRKRAARAVPPPVTDTLPSRPQDIQRTSSGHPRDGAGTVPYPTVPNHTQPERELTPPSARAREAKQPAPLSLPLVADTMEATTAINGSQNGSHPTPASTPPPTPERRSAPSGPVDALIGAFATALSPTRLTTSERQRWRQGAVDLHQSGITPEEVPKLVEAYRAQFGTDVPVHPRAIANNYSVLASKLGTLNGTHQSSTGSSAQAIAARAERDDAETQAKHARIAALAAQLAPGQPRALPAVPGPRASAVDSVRRAGDG